MKIGLSTILALSALAILGGCAEKTSENPPGYEEKDFRRTAPPPEYRGPGQPGAPQSGPVTPPPPASSQTTTESK